MKIRRRKKEWVENIKRQPFLPSDNSASIASPVPKKYNHLTALDAIMC